MNREEETIERRYERAFSQAGGLQTVFPAQAKKEMFKMVEEMLKGDEAIKNIFNTPSGKPMGGEKGLTGVIGERQQVEEYNLKSIVGEKGDKAFFVNGNDPVKDIKIVHADGTVTTVQSKISSSIDNCMGDIWPGGVPKYKDANEIWVPNDLVDGVRQRLVNKAQELKDTNPELAKEALDYSKKIKGTGHTYREHEDPENLQKDFRSKFQQESTLKHMGKAAVGAAASSAIVCGAYNTVQYCMLVREGKMSESDAVVKIMTETICSAADSALKAAVNTGIQSVMVRSATKEIIAQTAKQGARNMLKTNFVTTAVVSGVDMVKDLVRLVSGKITVEEFEERSEKGLLNTGTGAFGSSLGAAVGLNMMSTSVSLPAFGSVALGPLIGGMAGAIIAGMAMQFAIENYIDKPYRELIQNTETTRDSISMLQDVSQNVFKGQIVFEQYLRKEHAMNVEFETLMNESKQAGDEMRRVIDRI